MANRKRAASIRTDISVETNSVRFWALDYSTEKPVPGMDFRFECSKLAPALLEFAVRKGCEDSIRDAGALGADASLGQKFAAMKERAEYLASGATEWSRSSRETGESTLLFKALMRQKPERDEAKVLAFVRSKDRGTREKMLGDESLREIVAELRAEMGKAVDLTETWAELDEIDAE